MVVLDVSLPRFSLSACYLVITPAAEDEKILPAARRDVPWPSAPDRLRFVMQIAQLFSRKGRKLTTGEPRSAKAQHLADILCAS